MILQQPIDHEQLAKLLVEGRTDLLDKFVSNKTRRPFKAFLQWDAAAGKVVFGFEPRPGARPSARSAAKPTAKDAAPAARGAKPPATPRRKATGTATKPARTPAAGTLHPDAALAAVIGPDLVSRPQAMKKLWDYIKTHQLQDPQDKRTIVPDAALRAVLGTDRANMFALAGLIGAHLHKDA